MPYRSRLDVEVSTPAPGVSMNWVMGGILVGVGVGAIWLVLERLSRRPLILVAESLQDVLALVRLSHDDVAVGSVVRWRVPGRASRDRVEGSWTLLRHPLRVRGSGNAADENVSASTDGAVDQVAWQGVLELRHASHRVTQVIEEASADALDYAARLVIGRHRVPEMMGPMVVTVTAVPRVPHPQRPWGRAAMWRETARNFGAAFGVAFVRGVQEQAAAEDAKQAAAKQAAEETRVRRTTR